MDSDCTETIIILTREERGVATLGGWQSCHPSVFCRYLGNPWEFFMRLRCIPRGSSSTSDGGDGIETLDTT